MRLLLALAASVVACGLLLWPIPYAQVSLPGNPSFAALIACGAAAGLLAGLLLKRGLLAVLTVPTGFAIAVLGRMVVETNRDPTTHNLWPFEVAIVGVIGLLAGLIGVAAASLAQRLRSRG